MPLHAKECSSKYNSSALALRADALRSLKRCRVGETNRYLSLCFATNSSGVLFSGTLACNNTYKSPNLRRVIMSTMTTVDIVSNSPQRERNALLRELQELGRLSQYPAIYSDPELLQEVKQERREIISLLRELPLAG